jgi:hypothetical protein
VARHIFQACPVWIYTQSNITQASYSPEYITPTQQISQLIGSLTHPLSNLQHQQPVAMHILSSSFVPWYSKVVLQLA